MRQLAASHRLLHNAVGIVHFAGTQIRLFIPQAGRVKNPTQ
jgi:hypothetical protein